MSLRFSRSPSLLRTLPSRSFKRSLSSAGLLRTQNASHTGQRQLTCDHTRGLKPTYVEALKIAQEPATAKPTSMSDIEPAKLEIHPREPLKTLPKLSELVFGENFTDHMLTIPWNDVSGWGTPRIGPYGPLAIDPSSSVLHYAQAIFEGMKAYRDENGKVTLFRPEMNMKRMNTSASRLALPTFNGDALLTLIKELVKVDKHWIPKEPGHSLYIRPTLIGAQRALRVTPPNEALLFVVCAPVGPYYPKGFKPVSLHGTTEFIRAAPGGTGAYKLGANYAPGVMPQKKVNREGYTQNLWLHGPDHCLTEVGTMNAFVVFKRGETTALVTPPLDGMILPGVTRDSVLALARDHASGKRTVPGLPSNLVVEERNVTMAEIKSAAQKGELVELFGTGTAAIISPVDRIGYLGEDIDVPVGKDGMGPLSGPFWERLVGIQKGAIESDWNVVVCK